MDLKLVGAVFALSTVGIASVSLGGAAVGAPDDAGGRYEMSPVDGGFVRMDTETGAMSLCTRKSGAWSCRAMAEDRQPSDDDLDRLQKENAELKEDLRRMEETFGLEARGKRGDNDDEPVERTERPPEIQLPNEEQVDQAIDYLEGMLRKFRKRFEEFGDRSKPGDDRNEPDGEGTPL